MEIKLLNTEEQFKQLKKEDVILVKWSDNFVRHTPKAKNIMLYRIFENKAEDREIICQRKENHYFNYEMYLEGESSALEVYQVEEKPGEEK